MKAEATKKNVVRSPGRPRDEKREAAILEETLKLLGEVGFAGLTVDAVVARARASKATIYRRWATKEELAIAAFDLLPMIEVPDTGNLEDDVIQYLDQYGNFVRTTPLRSVLPALVSEAMHNPELAAKLRVTVEARRASGVEMVRQAIERGELPPSTDAGQAQELFIAPMLHRSFFAPENLSQRDFRAMARVIIAGLKAVGEATSTPA